MALGEADPMLPTTPTVVSNTAPTAGGALDKLVTSGKESKRTTISVVTVFIIAILAFFVIVIVMSCIYGMYMYRGRRRDKRAEHHTGNSNDTDSTLGK